MLFKLFSSGNLDGSSKILARSVARRYPPVIANDPEPMFSQKRGTEILGEIFRDAYQFDHQNRLGVLGRAKLGHAFKWESKKMGYEGKFVEMATDELIVYLTRRSK